jgi:hypothetical protein
MSDNQRVTYNSFSGVDMVCVFGRHVIGEVQGLSYTIQREVAPIYTMGDANPRGFSKGKRGIAGSLIFSVFDRSPLINAMRDEAYYLTLFKNVLGKDIKERVNIPGFDTGLTGTVGLSRITPGEGLVTDVSIDRVWAKAQYADQIPPFTIVVTAANESGAHASMKIFGVVIMNQGSGISVDDITTDEACTFTATKISPWENQGVVARPSR